MQIIDNLVYIYFALFTFFFILPLCDGALDFSGSVPVYLYIYFESYLFDFSYSNGINVEGATHKQVVDLIKSGGDKLVLTGFVLDCKCNIVPQAKPQRSLC